MGGGQKELSGPDFEQGVELGAIADGHTLLGHAKGEAVLVARLGDELFAIGATCTHYGGPLAEGLLVADEIRCPWHHACFSLRTGEAVRAPALSAVPCWKVEERAGKVFVLGKQDRDGDKTTVNEGPMDVLIVGAGAAGNAAAEALRRAGYIRTITMVGAEDTLPVDRPNLSKDYLAGNAPEEWIPLRSREWYEAQGIDLVLGDGAKSLDTKKRKVTLASGREITYDALLLATGAEPVKLAGVPGADRAHVHYLRSLADCRAIIARTASAKKAVVLGASFIGLECAASLRARKLDVHVVAPEKNPLEKALGAELGAMLRALHTSHGVVFHLEQTAKEIGENNVVLANGEVIDGVDLVLVGVGVAPRTALAEAAGLATDRGVTVDEFLETSAKGVYAAGDIARWPDAHTGAKLRVEHWVVAERQGQAVAANMLGERQPFDAVPFFWTTHYDVQVGYVGHAEGADRTVVDGDLAKHDAAVAFRRGDKTLAVATVGRDAVLLRAELALEEDDHEALAELVLSRG